MSKPFLWVTKLGSWLLGHVGPLVGRVLVVSGFVPWWLFVVPGLLTIVSLALTLLKLLPSISQQHL